MFSSPCDILLSWYNLNGQDFIQLLSMFANFDFTWPSQLTSLYHVFSLVNFNFDLLAPECSVSLNFEEKWFIVQSLPLLLFLSIAVVIVGTRVLQEIQRVLLGRLPFGSLSALNLIDVCIGIGISGVFMLYFGMSLPAERGWCQSP